MFKTDAEQNLPCAVQNLRSKLRDENKEVRNSFADHVALRNRTKIEFNFCFLLTMWEVRLNKYCSKVNTG